MANGSFQDCVDQLRKDLRELREKHGFDEDTIALALEAVAPEFVGRGFSDLGSTAEDDSGEAADPQTDEENDGG